MEATLSRLEAITGVSRHILHVLCAEIGIDLSRFPDAAHLASWAGMCPGQRESAGKRQSGRIRPGNKYVKSALVQAAHATLPALDLSWGAIPSPQTASREQTRSSCGRAQYPGDLLSYDDDG